eukprot:6485218-Amphidinium_carterae.1
MNINMRVLVSLLKERSLDGSSPRAQVTKLSTFCLQAATSLQSDMVTWHASLGAQPEAMLSPKPANVALLDLIIDMLGTS